VIVIVIDINDIIPPIYDYLSVKKLANNAILWLGIGSELGLGIGLIRFLVSVVLAKGNRKCPEGKYPTKYPTPAGIDTTCVIISFHLSPL